MTRDETIALFSECEAKRAEARAAAFAKGMSESDARFIIGEAGKAHWNAWAEKMLSKRKQLEASNLWALEQGPGGDCEPKNSETRAWMNAATADFSGCLFLIRESQRKDFQKLSLDVKPLAKVMIDGDRVDMRGLIFPGDARFDSAIFDGYADFVDATFMGRAQFESVKFHNAPAFIGATFEEARFAWATFNGGAQFSDATFKVTAFFYGAAFEGWTSFGGAKLCSAAFDYAGFRGEAYFGSAKFVGSQATFIEAKFVGDALFHRVIFERDVTFDASTFSNGTIFESATFREEAMFRSATFSDYAIFESAKFLGVTSFANSTFSKQTSFVKAKFGESGTGDASFAGIKVDRAFAMTGASFSQVPNFTNVDFSQPPDLDSVIFPLPRWGGDPDLIPKYRAVCRMAIQGADYDREQMAFKGEIRSKRGTEHRWYNAAIWYGLAYDALSDFGRSMSRPSLIWLISIAIFALFYLVDSNKLGSAFVDCAAAVAPNYESALIISWKNALPLIGIDSKAEEIARGCLYGAAAYSGIATQGLQKVWSAVLIFLFLLAVRNQFKIK